MKIKGVFVIAGHSVKSPGALGYDGTYEHIRTTSLQRKIVEKLRNYAVGVMVDDETMPLSSVVSWVNKNVRAGWVIIDLHFNNNFPGATGTEIFVAENSEPWLLETAERMVEAISKAQGIRVRMFDSSRKYKFPKESARGQLAIIEKTILEGTNPPTLLPEICFLNNIDLPKYNEDKVAEAIVTSLNLPTWIGDLDPKTEKRV